LHYKCNETLFHYNLAASRAYYALETPPFRRLAHSGKAMPPTPILEVT